MYKVRIIVYLITLYILFLSTQDTVHEHNCLQSTGQLVSVIFQMENDSFDSVFYLKQW